MIEIGIMYNNAITLQRIEQVTSECGGILNLLTLTLLMFDQKMSLNITTYKTRNVSVLQLIWLWALFFEQQSCPLTVAINVFSMNACILNRHCPPKHIKGL